MGQDSAGNSTAAEKTNKGGGQGGEEIINTPISESSQAARGNEEASFYPHGWDVPALEENTSSLHPPQPPIKCQAHKIMVTKGMAGRGVVLDQRHPPPQKKKKEKGGGQGKNRLQVKTGLTPGPNTRLGSENAQKVNPKKSQAPWRNWDTKADDFWEDD